MEQTLAVYDKGDELQTVMRQTGYRPSFYTIPETEGELKLSLTVTGRQSARPSNPARPATTEIPSRDNTRVLSTAVLARSQMIAPKIYAAPVDGRYQNSFNFSSNVSATIRFKIVAVPPPAQAEQARVVPNFATLKVSEALELAESFDLQLEGVAGTAADAEIDGQDPTPGSLTTAGALIIVTLKP